MIIKHYRKNILDIVLPQNCQTLSHATKKVYNILEQGNPPARKFFARNRDKCPQNIIFHQSASKHGRRTFLQRDERTGMQRATLGKSGSEAAP